VPFPTFQPLALARKPEPFSHPDWLYEIKWDGFRSLAKLEHGRCKLISRNGNDFKSFPNLTTNLPKQLLAESAVLDGEIVCLHDSGRTQFCDLLFRRGEPRFYAFDLLLCNGEDLRFLPLMDRKQRLRSLMPRGEVTTCCTAITLRGTVKNCFGWCAKPTSKELSPSRNSAPIWPSTQIG
jgi:bifunctional non-homologous end joining protein LigD